MKGVGRTVSSTAKFVICLDLASSINGSPIQKVFIIIRILLIFILNMISNFSRFIFITIILEQDIKL